MSWAEKRISELGEIVTGKTPSTKVAEFFGGEYPFVTPSDIEYGHYYARNTETTVTELAKSKHRNQFVPKESVLFTCIGNTMGKCAIAAQECMTNQQINAVVANGDNDPKFLYYLLHHSRNIVRGIGMGGGAATPIINKTTFGNVKLRLPTDKLTQQTISSVLSAYDDLIENNRRRIELLEESARQLYKEWFVRFRFPGHEHVKIIDGIPEGWNHKTLSEVVTLVKDTVDPKNIPETTPYIGLEHLPRRSLTLNIWENAGKVSSSKFAFKCGDIIFGKIRPYFHKVGFTLVDGITSSDSIVLRPKLQKHYCVALSEVTSDAFVALASKTVREGSKMPRADWDVLKNRILLEPPEAILSVFNNAIEAILNQCKLLSVQNLNLVKARDILLPRLMSGEIAV